MRLRVRQYVCASVYIYIYKCKCVCVYVYLSNDCAMSLTVGANKSRTILNALGLMRRPVCCIRLACKQLSCGMVN